MKIINFLALALILTFFSCKKEEEVTINPCANGKLDAGEDEIDCGGTCKACLKYSYLLVNYNDSLYQVNNKSLIFEGTVWNISADFGGIQVNLNLGSNGEVGIYNLNSTGSSCIKDQLPYTFVSGAIGIGEHDVLNREMSGNFEAIFNRGLDTIKLTSGQFEYLPY